MPGLLRRLLDRWRHRKPPASTPMPADLPPVMLPRRDETRVVRWLDGTETGQCGDEPVPPSAHAATDW